MKKEELLKQCDDLIEEINIILAIPKEQWKIVDKFSERMREIREYVEGRLKEQIKVAELKEEERLHLSTEISRIAGEIKIFREMSIRNSLPVEERDRTRVKGKVRRYRNQLETIKEAPLSAWKGVPKENVEELRKNCLKMMKTIEESFVPYQDEFNASEIEIAEHFIDTALNILGEVIYLKLEV